MGGIEALAKHVPPEFVIDPQPRMELINGDVSLDHSRARVGFLCRGSFISDDPHHREEFVRRLKLSLPMIAREAWIPSPEDVIIQKLRWGRTKDLDDARNVLSVQSDALDFPYIEAWCERHGTRARLEEVRRSIPEI